MWTEGSFNQFLLSAQMKYLEGNIFVNFYIFGGAGIAAVLLSSVVYARFGLKNSLYLGHGLCIVGCLGALVVQTHLIPFAEQRHQELFEERVMPAIILALKMGIIVSFIITTQVSFTDDRIFPPNQRNTSVGTCGMIARSVTIFAPICNEWPAPFPILLMLGWGVVGLLTSVTFPDEDEFTPGIAQKEVKYDYGLAEEENESTVDGNERHEFLNESLGDEQRSQDEDFSTANTANQRLTDVPEAA